MLPKRKIRKSNLKEENCRIDLINKLQDLPLVPSIVDRLNKSGKTDKITERKKI